MTAEPTPGRSRSAVSGARLAAALVAVMLLLAGIAYLFADSVGPFGDSEDDDDPNAPPRPGSVVTISQDTRWTGLSGAYNSYAVVWAGRTLTLEDCDITVALEDLIIADRPLFTVTDGGTLRLEETRIRVTLDPNITRAVYHSAVNMNRWDTEVPVLSRVVNLQHATSPVLSLNVSWRASRTDLVVVGQRSTNQSMQLLARLGSGGDGWEHVEVDLSALAGSVARVAVFPLDNEYDVLFISDAMVLDGGEVPLGDRFGAASLAEDGWDLSSFNTLMVVGEGYHTPYMGPLIESQGTLVLDNCTIEEPAGLPRWAQADDFYPSNPSDLIARHMYLTSTIGLQVQADRGSVQLRSTELLNVPLRAERAELLIQDSHLAGDADVLTCRRCNGTVRGSDILRAPPPDVRGYDLDEKEWTWAVSIEEDDPTRHLALEDVSVQGGDLGMYIGGKGPLMDGCSFSGSSVICLWSDGPSEPPSHGGWPQLNASCSFGPSEGHRYFETRLCEVELVWSEPFSGSPPSGSVLIPMWEWRGLPDVQEGSYMEDSKTTIRLPAVSVNATGEVRPFANVTVSIDPSPGPTFERILVPGSAYEVVEVDPWTGTTAEVRELLGDYNLAQLHVIPSEDAGEATLDLITTPDVLNEYFAFDDVIVRTWLNGAALQESYLHEGVLVDDYRVPPYPWGIHFPRYAHLEPGINELNVSFLVRSWGEPRYESVWDKTFSLLRANASTNADEARATLADEGMLLLDPGEVLELGELLPSDEYEDLNYVPLNCALWNSSDLLTGAVRGESSWSYIYGLYTGPGNLTLHDGETNFIDLRVVNGTLRIEDLKYGGFSSNLYWSRLEVLRSDLIWGGGVIAWTCSTLLVEDCIVRADTQRSSILDVGGYEAYTFNMTNTTLVGAEPTRITFSAYYGADILLNGCTFTNVTMHVSPNVRSGLGNISVFTENCTFQGDCAYLVALDPNNVDLALSTVLLWLGGCDFIGPRTGVATQVGTHTILDDVALEGGAMVISFRPITIDLPSSRPRYRTTVVGEPFLPAFMNISPFKSEYGDLLFEDYLLAFDIQEGDLPPGYPGATVTLMIDTGDEVVWFVDVEPVGRRIYVDVPDWERIGGVVTRLRADILAGIDWWT